MMGVLLIAVLLTISGGPDYSGYPTGAPDSPITWFGTVADANIDSVTAIGRSNTYIGIEFEAIGVVAELVAISDRSPFGENLNNTLVWLVSYDSTWIHNAIRDDSLLTTLYVALSADDGRLLLAFAKSRSTWIAPCVGKVDPESRTPDVDFKPIDQSPNCSVLEVLAHFRTNWAHVPLQYGQIVLRPRYVDTVRIRGSIYGPGTIWIIQVLGTVAAFSHPPVPPEGSDWDPVKCDYYTGFLCVASDKSCECVMGTGLD